MPWSVKAPLVRSFSVTLSLPGRMCSFARVEITPVITGGLVFDRELQEVFDSPCRHVDCEIDVVSPAPDVDDGAMTEEVRSAQRRVDRLQIGVAGCSIYHRPKSRRQGHGVIGRVQRKVWHIGRTLHRNPIELSIEGAGRVQHATETLDGVQICVFEDISARGGGIAGSLRVPGAKAPDGVDLSLRDRVGQHRVIRPGCIGTNVVEHDVLEDEQLWILVGLVVPDHQRRVVADNLLDDDLDLAGAVRLYRTVLPHRSRCDVDRQAGHEDRLHMHGFEEETKQ